MRLVIISGLSGSGKSVALATLEDCGFYCIDNLPAALLQQFGAHLMQAGDENPYAVGIDARNRPSELARIPEILDELKAQGLQLEIVFLDADTPTLLKRFSETRRRHPLSNSDTPLAEAIQGERDLLMPLHGRADLTLDTTHTTLHELRQIVRQRLVQSPNTLSVLLQSFGFKHGTPPDADFVFDSRCLPNPHWQAALRAMTGKDAPVVEYLAGNAMVGRYESQVLGFLQEWLPVFEAENRSYLTIAIGCTGGQHRSVYLVERLAKQLESGHIAVSVRHRELP